jgi:hypothetical protein
MHKYLVVGATIAATLGAVLACGGDESCGDGYCASDESCGTCAADCGRCGDCGSISCSTGSIDCCPGARPGTWSSAYSRCDCGGCFISDDCAFDEICAAGSCESVWGRAYRITAVGGVYYCAAADWDGSAADPFVVVVVDGVTHSSPYLDDTIFPTWNYSFEAAVSGTSTFDYTVYNDNWSSDDVIVHLSDGPIPFNVTWLHDGGFESSTSDGSCTTSFTFEPL